MFYVGLTLFIFGLISLIVGYRKTDRKLLLIGAILFLLSGALGEAIEGFSDGWNRAQTEEQSATPTSGD